jgi:endonuclease YncB( thermonuclease family)
MTQLDHVVRTFAPVRRTPARRVRAARSKSGFAIAMVALPLAAFSAVFLWDGPPRALGVEALRPVASIDREAASFGECTGSVRINCVVDGDTFWYRGEKIRIADINTPEVSEPGCAREAALGARATRRLLALLNDGAFSLERDPSGRDTDRYGRKLRSVYRNGESLGRMLVDEGLAETWKGYRSSWC